MRSAGPQCGAGRGSAEMTRYYRPLAHYDVQRPAGAKALAGGSAWFDRVEVLGRGQAPEIIPADQLPAETLTRLTAARAPIAGLEMAAPQVMGILNVTPDSFSDGGDYAGPAAVARALAMVRDGASIIDIGGESTRPGAAEVSPAQEIARTAPVIAAIRAESDVPISIDTRKSEVARAALAAGATLVNDVAAFRFDPALAEVVAGAGVPVCLMHSIANPQTMQAQARYDDVLLDVYDALAARIAVAEATGIARSQIIIDPGIGFGKTLDHNLALLRRLSLFHGLGCVVLLGASRKRFIGTIGQADAAKNRLGGSLAVALDGVRQGVQILRVHDTFATKQAIDLQAAVSGAAGHGG